MPRQPLTKAAQGAEVVLQTVSDSADAFGPLKSVASGGLSILRLVKAFKKNKKDWEALGNDVAKGIIAVERHCIAARPERKTTLDNDLSDLSHALAEVVQEIRTLEQRRSLARFLAIHEHRDEIGGMKEKISRAFNDFELQSSIALRRDAERRKESELVNGIPHVGAAYNGHLHQALRLCLPGTRTKLLQTVHEWLDSTSMPRMLCLTGLAGTGKSTVAYSIAAHYDALRGQPLTHRLGASFFFSSGSAAASDGSQFFSTLAYQLARRDPAVRGAIVANSEAVRDACSANFRVQYESLIRVPLSSVRRSDPWYSLIVVDSLDLCAADVRRSILSCLIELAEQLSFVKILLTTRRDFETRGPLMTASRTGVAIIQDMPHDVLDGDITHFLSSSLVVDVDGMAASWQPSELHVNELATRSAGLFIFASVAVRYIVGSAELIEPSVRLRLLLDATSPRDLDADDQSNPYATLDRLYHQVFSSIPVAVIPTLVVALEFLCASLHTLALHSMECLLRHNLRNDGSISRALTTVEALLAVPADSVGPVALIHPSLAEYLTSPERCLDPRILVRPAEAHGMLARACMAVMREELHRGACEERQDQVFPLSALGYACMFWAGHFQAAAETVAITIFAEDMRFFCCHQLLHWIEWMAATSELPRALENLRIAISLSQKEHLSEAELLIDARKMLLAFWEPLSEDPQQIYRSALAFLPRLSLLRRHYSGEGQPVKILHGLTESWDPCDRTIAAHGAEITSVVFSDNGDRVASASRDGTVKVWDPVNGSCQGIMSAHAGPCANVQFCPSGKSLLSAGGEGDNKIMIRDLESQDELCTIQEGTRAIVTAISYRCGNNDFVACATVEGDIRIWNTQTLQCVATLRGHSDAVTSLVVFSATELPLLFSCSDDQSVRLWNLATRESTCVETSDSSCLSLALSHDGCLLACGTASSGVTMWEVKGLNLHKKWTSRAIEYAVVSLCFITESEHLVVGCESTPLIRILLSQTGETVRTFLSGHIYGVHSLAYSAGAGLLVSASSDQTLCVYGTRDLLSRREEVFFSSRRPRCLAFSTSGTLVSVGYGDGTIMIHALEPGSEIDCNGHQAGITDLVFCCDDVYLLSSSEDSEVRAWGVSSGACLRIFKAHTGEVTCLSTSQSRFVTGSHDTTVKMWEVQTDQVVHSFDGHTGSVHAVATHSTCAASASGDRTVRLWSLDKRRPGRVLRGHSHPVTAVGFSEDGEFVASGSDSGDVIVWEGDKGDIIFQAKVDAYSSLVADIRMHMVCFVRNDSAVAAILDDGQAGIFDLGFEGSVAPNRPSAPKQIFGPESFDFAWIVDLLAREQSRRLLWIPNRHRCDSYLMASHANIISIVSKHGHLIIARFDDLL